MELFANNIKVPYGGKISLKFFNPLFNDIGTYSFPISFPSRLPVINKAFGFPVNQESGDPGTIEAIIKSNIINLVGNWQINETQGGSVGAYYKGSNGDFYSRIKDKLLTDLEFGGIHYPAGIGADVGTVLAFMTTKMDSVYPDNDWNAFMVYMPNAIAGAGTEVNPITHDEDTGIPRFTNPGATLNSTVYLFAGTILDYIFSEYGYRIEKNIFKEDEDLKRLVIFNTYNRYADDAFDYTKLVPKILISDFLKAIRNKFNVGFFINEQNRSVKILSFDSIILSGPMPGKLNSSALKVNKNKITGLSFGINSPDEWSSNKFASLEEIDPNNTLITVDKYNDINAGMFEKKVFVIAESTYYDVGWTGIATRICPDQFIFITGNNPTDVEQLSGTLGMYTLNKNFETAVEYIVPRCDLESNRSGYAYTVFPLIFLLSRGKQDCQVYYIPGAFERQYPMGTSDIYNAKGDAIGGATLALRWHGNYGIIERFWANRINWELNSKVITTTSFLGKDLSKLLDFSSIIRSGGSNYLINSLNVELSNKITRITEAELFRL